MFQMRGMLSKDESTSGEAKSHKLTYLVPNAMRWSLKLSTDKRTLGEKKLTKGSLTCMRKAMSTTKLVMYPTTMPMIPLATIEEPMFISNCKRIKALHQ
jgi:hypothetical protein